MESLSSLLLCITEEVSIERDMKDVSGHESARPSGGLSAA